MKTKWITLLILLFSLSVSANEVARVNTVIGKVQITEVDKYTRCLELVNDQDIQSIECMSSIKPTALYSDGSQSLIFPLLLNPDPEYILVIGHRAGALLAAYKALAPNAVIDVIEPIEVISNYSERHFVASRYRERLLLDRPDKIINEALETGFKYDLIINQLIDPEAQPYHLFSKERLQSVQQLLSESGVYAVWLDNQTFLKDHQFTHIQAFGGAVYSMNHDAGATIIAVNGGVPRENQFIRDNAVYFAKILYTQLGVNVNDWLTSATRIEDANGGRILYDSDLSLLAAGKSLPDSINIENFDIKTVGKGLLVIALIAALLKILLAFRASKPTNEDT